MKIFVLFVSILLFSTSGMSSHHEGDATLEDIKNTLGSVPKFLAEYPKTGIVGAWGEMKSLQLNPNTALSGMHKELIALAVASQIPCKYCIYFHTQAAKFHGASDEQVKEAIAISAIGAYWATYFRGMSVDFDDFKDETEKILKFTKKKMEPGYKEEALPAINVVDADTAYQDMERNLGRVPYFVKPISKSNVAGAWLNIKGVLFNPATSIPKKIKLLIALGSQTDNKHGLYWDKQFAKLHGATDQEIMEAVNMAMTTRHWSTWINGNGYDIKAFKKETDKIFAHLKKQSKKGN